MRLASLALLTLAVICAPIVGLAEEKASSATTAASNGQFASEPDIASGTVIRNAPSGAFLWVIAHVPTSSSLGGGRADITIEDSTGKEFWRAYHTLTLDSWAKNRGGAWDSYFIPVPSGSRASLATAGDISVKRFQFVTP